MKMQCWRFLNYYGKRSDELNEFHYPDFSRGNLDIPTFVSNGYLVFVPDIHHRQGDNATGVVNSITTAIQYLSRFPWIDKDKLGLQGHSFGGWETNVLITKTHLFAAACEAAGATNLLSAYGQLSFGLGNSRQSFYESGSQGSSYGRGVTPWTKPEIYMKNSPLFEAGRVITPLLMMHSKQDGSVPFEQAIEFFLALRRENKRVWLLQYDHGGHILGNDLQAWDYSIRMMQFFDHYLKDSAAPKWMLTGIQAKMKGIDNGLELVKEKDPETGKWITPP